MAETEPNGHDSDRLSRLTLCRLGEEIDSFEPDNTSAVAHPQHYNQVPGVECIDIVEHFDFVLGNVIKYAWRAGLKSGVTKLEDLQKMAWYAQRAIEREIKRVETN